MYGFGKLFRVSIFGESHGDKVGVVVDCPAGIRIHEKALYEDLERRKGGKEGTTQRQEQDIPIISSGVLNDYTTGAPVMIYFKNRDTKSEDYYNVRDIPRPGHADFVSHKKYNAYADYRGGGHFSGRLTVGIVAAGYIAKQILNMYVIQAKVIEIGGVTGEKNIQETIRNTLDKKDSVGGIIECTVKGMDIGLGEPFFDSIESVISHAIFSIPAIKGIEFGAGFMASKMLGSEHNDPLIDMSGKTQTNYSGGINGGISNGNDMLFRVAVKPPSSISKPQHTLNIKTEEMDTLQVTGRHDCCIALRMPVIIESMTAIALADLYLRHKKIY